MKAQVVSQRLGLDGRVYAAGGQQREQCLGKAQPLGVLGDVVRLDAQAVAHEVGDAAVALSQRKDKHALQPL